MKKIIKTHRKWGEQFTKITLKYRKLIKIYEKMLKNL